MRCCHSNTCQISAVDGASYLFSIFPPFAATHFTLRRSMFLGTDSAATDSDLAPPSVLETHVHLHCLDLDVLAQHLEPIRQRHGSSVTRIAGVVHLTLPDAAPKSRLSSLNIGHDSLFPLLVEVYKNISNLQNAVVRSIQEGDIWEETETSRSSWTRTRWISRQRTNDCSCVHLGMSTS